jgi:hypothetical protein
MKRNLTYDDVMAAVWGGAILGGGGGGIPIAGERAARLATEVGTPQLWSVDEFDPEALSATVALVGAPAAPFQQVKPGDMIRTLDLLRGALPGRRELEAINTNENGAETTVNGWFHAALTGLPVIDLACNGRAHPTSLMGALGLHTEPDYVSIQAFAGGAPERYVEGVARGRIGTASAVVRQASIEAGGLVCVARNPVSVDYARRNGAPGAISYAMDLGYAYITGGLPGAARWLDAQVVAEGKVLGYRCEQRDGVDIGSIRLDDQAATTLRFINEYMVLEQYGERVASFPDLIMTFTGDGKPAVSAQVTEGADLRVLLAPAASLLLSRTMHMPELYKPLEVSLGMALAPQCRETNPADHG